MKITYNNLMGPALGWLFNAGCDDYDKALEIVKLKEAAIAHMKRFKEIKNQFMKAFKITNETILNASHPHYAGFVMLMEQVVDLDAPKEKIEIEFQPGMTANDIVVLRNFAVIKKAKEKKETA